ncbi:MAG: glycosyltransferase family 2 protein [Deltaproteobacteria bacterium]|nr:glycosyltransferase family 2 protein [Deltaproteobacteria bacterium]
MTGKRYPSLSIIIPTLNSERVFQRCLESIFEQDYPEHLVEILVVDGGSEDATLETAKEFQARRQYTIRVISNPLKTGEAGKAVGVRHAKNDILAFIDSDNILPHESWLQEMVAPFEDQNIVASEPLFYTYRRRDGYINRYCALIGMNDPVCLFMGNYDRLCSITERWTGLQVLARERGRYLLVRLEGRTLPTIGANGFLIRRNILTDMAFGEFLFDVDVLPWILEKEKSIQVAKVKTGIIHLFCENLTGFAKKQKRRILDYYRLNVFCNRKVAWPLRKKIGLGIFVLSCVYILPLLWQSLIGFCRKKDTSWFFHPVACWTTLGVYGFAFMAECFGTRREQPRVNWTQ